MIFDIRIGVDLLLRDGPYEPVVGVCAVEPYVVVGEDDSGLVLRFASLEVNVEPPEVEETESLAYQLACPLFEDLGEDVVLGVLVAVAGITCGTEVVEDVAGLGRIA